MSTPSFTFAKFLKKYPNDDVCLDELYSRFYGSIECCPECEAKADFVRVKGRKCYSCTQCSHQIYPMAGTIFEKSTTPLTLWFYAMYLFAKSKNGVSAKELQRHLGVSYPTAHRMGHAIRSLMDETKEVVFTGKIEMDETLIGGKFHGKRGWGSENKVCVFGMVERGGKMVTTIVPNRRRETLFPIVVKHTTEDVVAFTDDFTGYRTLAADCQIESHSVICHRDNERVRGEVHTQTMDGHWSIIKRSIRGTYTSVSKKYLQNYLNEFTFRFNHRNEPDQFDSLNAGIKKGV